VRFVQPTTWAEALEAVAALPGGLPVAGGTDVMVELSFHRRRPEALIDLGRVQGLGEVTRDGGWLRVGAAATYDQLTVALREDLPALALAARTVGSPQIRSTTYAEPLPTAPGRCGCWLAGSSTGSGPTT
jgi:CO/xanthine dehydrogenase FAD-binding subunit